VTGIAPLADEQLREIRYRAQRPSQYTAATIRQDYDDMLAEIRRLRGELGLAEELADFSRGENARLREDVLRFGGLLAAVHAMHTESIASPCPVCVNGDSITNGGDGTVPYPCPTLIAAGISPDAGLPPAHREAHAAGRDCGFPSCEVCTALRDAEPAALSA
jgi:hypothetical protein